MPPTEPTVQTDLRPQAILLPRPLGPSTPPGFDAHDFIRDNIAPLLGVPTVHTYAEMNQYFVAPSGDDTLFFPALGPLKSQERYVWFVAGTSPTGPFTLGEQVASFRDRPDVVKFGYVRDPASVSVPTPAAKAEFDADRMAFVTGMRQRVARMVELLQRERGPGLDASQQAELDAIKKEVM